MGTGSPREDRGLPDEVVADLLASERRQLVVRELARTGSGLTVADLVRLLCEETTDCEARDGEVNRTLLSEVFDDHLSKLVATGVVEYDSMRGRVELARPELLATTLRLETESG